MAARGCIHQHFYTFCQSCPYFSPLFVIVGFKASEKSLFGVYYLFASYLWRFFEKYVTLSPLHLSRWHMAQLGRGEKPSPVTHQTLLKESLAD